MRTRAGKGRVQGFLITACLLVIASGTAVAGSGTAAAASQSAPAANTVTVTPPGDQATVPGTPVSLQISATDSDPAQTLTYSAGTPTTLPPDLTISPDGLITGTPTAADTGTYNVTITATDTTSATGTATFTWTVAYNKITLTAPKRVQSKVGVPIAPVRITARDAEPGVALSYVAAPLPAGLRIDHATGVISGKPKALARVSTVVTVTDATGSSARAVISWQVGGFIRIADPGRQVLRLGEPVGIPLRIADSAAHDALNIRVLGLPAGVGFHRVPPVLTGWPVKARGYEVSVTIRGKDGGFTRVRFPIRVRAAASAGPTGLIRLDLAGKCLDDPRNRAARGTRVDIARCAGRPGQRWTRAEDSTIRIHGKCLAYSGRALRLENCTASANEIWLKGTDARLVNAASGRCLADPRSSTRNGTRPVLAKCTSNRNERWTAPASALLSGQMGMCADDHFSSGSNGNVIDAFFCNGSPAQRWQVRPDGTLRIFGDKCMTVRGRAGRPGAKIELWSCGRSARQRWTMVRRSRFSMQIRNGHACLAVPSGTSPNGTQLILARCTGTRAITEWHAW